MSCYVLLYAFLRRSLLIFVRAIAGIEMPCALGLPFITIHPFRLLESDPSVCLFHFVCRIIFLLLLHESFSHLSLWCVVHVFFWVPFRCASKADKGCMVWMGFQCFESIISDSSTLFETRWIFGFRCIFVSEFPEVQLSIISTFLCSRSVGITSPKYSCDQKLL